MATGRLRRADPSRPGLTRRRAGRGFVILDADGVRVQADETLAHVRALSIPPAWRDVWISPDPLGHLQATGIDAAGRTQYRYHDRWRTRRDQQKFDAMLDFARALPKLRRRVQRDLDRDGLPRERVLACAARLLDLGFFRVGGEGYAEQNKSFGLATMQRRHVRFRGEEIVFDYPAKSGRQRVQAIVDADARAVVERLKRRRGGSRPDLLAFKQGGRWTDVRSEDINEYVKEVSENPSFSAKDFRTWNATVLASVAIATGPDAASKSARKRALRAAVGHVASYLGNTPAVARASYIDPRVFDRYLSGWTIGGALDQVGGEADLGRPLVRARIEDAVLDLLEGEKQSPALEKVA
ncbi:MAG: DNA topoisomerase IB [Solirubrobacteraceae bacterium]